MRRKGQDCRMMGPASKCFCGHRYKDHNFDNIESRKVHCKTSKCKCRSFSYIPICKCKIFLIMISFMKQLALKILSVSANILTLSMIQTQGNVFDRDVSALNLFQNIAAIVDCNILNIKLSSKAQDNCNLSYDLLQR